MTRMWTLPELWAKTTKSYYSNIVLYRSCDHITISLPNAGNVTRVGKLWKQLLWNTQILYVKLAIHSHRRSACLEGTDFFGTHLRGENYLWKSVIKFTKMQQIATENAAHLPQKVKQSIQTILVEWSKLFWIHLVVLFRVILLLTYKILSILGVQNVCNFHNSGLGHLYYVIPQVVQYRQKQ